MVLTPDFGTEHTMRVLGPGFGEGPEVLAELLGTVNSQSFGWDWEAGETEILHSPPPPLRPPPLQRAPSLESCSLGRSSCFAAPKSGELHFSCG